MADNPQAFHDWLSQIKCLPGILGGGVRFPDRSCYSDSNLPEFSTPHLDSAWHHLAEILQGLKGHRMGPVRMCWSHEHALIHYICRPDGICLALICRTGEGAPDQILVDQLATQFLSA